MTWCVLGSGASMSSEIATRVRHLSCIAVNNAYELAPWAKALVGGDAAWWKQKPEAQTFQGDKWCSTTAVDKHHRKYLNVRRLPKHFALGSQTNSGLLALNCAITVYGAKRVLLFGIDLVGKHYHADHPKPLGNPDENRFQLFRAQFADYAQLIKGIEVLNCSPISTITCFPKCTIEEALNNEELAAA